MSANFKLSGYKIHAEARERYIATETSTSPPVMEVIPTLESQVKMRSVTEKNSEYRLEGSVVASTNFNFTKFNETITVDATNNQLYQCGATFNSTSANVTNSTTI